MSYASTGKRCLDLVLGSILALCALPLMAVVGLLVLLHLGRPVLFRQERAGRGGRAFRLYKFRTMREERDARGERLPDAQRLTRLGQLLRSTSLDELPELGNVLRGDMSLVGPRPLLPAYNTRYTAEEARRLEVRPGITGWAQVQGRNASTWEERFAHDNWYRENLSLGLDVAILARTVGVVLRREGIRAEGEATMPEFRPPSNRKGE
jgi:lipopolysaccharide/colanic/teichoic acid biosynthesis glycosyltransferase